MYHEWEIILKSQLHAHNYTYTLQISAYIVMCYCIVHVVEFVAMYAFLLKLVYSH